MFLSAAILQTHYESRVINGSPDNRVVVTSIYYRSVCMLTGSEFIDRYKQISYLFESVKNYVKL